MGCLCFDHQFVTRAIRIMEWIANMDLSGYQNQTGLTAIINRLEVHCTKFTITMNIITCYKMFEELHML